MASISKYARESLWHCSARMAAGKTTFIANLGLAVSSDIGCGKFWPVMQLPAQAAAVRARLGVVTHLPLLYGDLSAEENLKFYGRMYGITELNHRVNEILDLVGLAERRHDLVRTFSRGMQQRLAIGRAILHNPEVMLFDEPHTGLDQDACDMLDSLLRDVAGRGRTVIMTSHDLARVENLATRFDVLSRGVIAASIRRDDLGRNNLLDFYRQSLAG